MIIIPQQTTVYLGDTTHFDAVAARVEAKIHQINESTARANAVVNSTFSDGTRLMNLILANIQQNQAVQAIQATQQVIQTAISINTIRLQATAAFAAQNYFSGVVLTASGIMLGYQLIAARMAEAQAKRNFAETQRINRMRLSFR